MTTVYLGIGSNVEREKHLHAAWQALGELDAQRQASPVYESPALGFESTPFYNLVMKIDTTLDLASLVEQLRQIEYQHGRAVDAQKFEDRTLDIDILLFGELISDQLPKLPRDDVFRYPFVIQPLYDLAPSLIIPGDGRTVAQIWREQGPFESRLCRVDFSFSV